MSSYNLVNAGSFFRVTLKHVICDDAVSAYHVTSRHRFSAFWSIVIAFDKIVFTFFIMAKLLNMFIKNNNE